MDLKGSAAVVTGASSGIGLAVAELLAREGVAVVLGARRVERLDEAVSRIRAAGGRAESVPMDVTRATGVAELVSRAERAFGRLDIMICNAGFGYYGPVEDMDPDVMQRMMDVNFMGTFHGARAALPVFRQQGRGHLIFVSSIAGRRGIPFMSGYSATKAAQAAFAESLRSELAGTDVHVTAVFPVSTTTEFREVMARDFGHQVSGLGPKQSVDHVARTIVQAIRRPVAEVFPHRAARGLVILNAAAPALTDRLVRKYGRRRVVDSARADSTQTRAR
jgi:short-subunit dehydrogenase